MGVQTPSIWQSVAKKAHHFLAVFGEGESLRTSVSNHINGGLVYYLTASLLLLTTPLLPKTEEKQSPIKPVFQLNSNDLIMKFGGNLRDESFMYKNVRTLRSDISGYNSYIKHKLDLDWHIEQGGRRYGKPASEAAVKLSNYVYWQHYDIYTPLSLGDLRSQDMDNVIVSRDVKVKPLIPLVFVEEAWLKLNFDTFAEKLKNRPTFLKVGFFKYEVGRGLAMGYHNDLAIDYLGWTGQGNYTKYSNMPPGILFRMQLHKDLTGDLYFMKWHELGATLADTMASTRAQRLDGYRPDRGTNKDRENYVLKFDYTPKKTAFGDVHLEPYIFHTRAPEQTIEFEADASAYLTTLGTMAEFKINNFEVNVEVAGQFGHQNVYAIDRNIKMLSKTGGVTYSHIVYDNGGKPGYTRVQVKPVGGATATFDNTYNPTAQLIDTIINSATNKSLDMQGKKIGTLDAATTGLAGNTDIYNANFFGNKRFRPAYKLTHQGVMALADVSYTFQELPYKLAVAAGYISGDAYPYNEETSRTTNTFIPMRSLYEGNAVKNFLIFDRLDLPRPINLSYRTLFAQNNLLDLGNLQFAGLGFTWYPCHDHKKLSLITDIMWLWEVAHLKKWDRYATHPDAAIETELKLNRAKLGFPGVPHQYTGATDDAGNSGWFSDEDASRMLGAEIDIKALYKLLDHCDAFARLAVFIPGGLYYDLKDQPNVLTRHIDAGGNCRYDSLGNEIAVGFILGLNYKF